MTKPTATENTNANNQVKMLSGFHLKDLHMEMHISFDCVCMCVYACISERKRGSSIESFAYMRACGYVWLNFLV